jgi:tRNA modification GTPase
MDLETTIVAVSSARGNSHRALIRITGEDAQSGTEQLGVSIKEREFSTGVINIPEGPLPICSLFFPKESSFSGQDTVEIELPNNEFLIDSVLRQLIKTTNGRYAEAGEFTARAFLNGNISLSEAEGVCATISASNDGELLGASLLRNGALHGVVLPVSTQLVKLLSLVESGIDFTDEEDVVAITDDNLISSIDHLSNSITSILDGRVAMATLQHLPTVVIAGLPNAGKSTLFNALLGRQRVICSDTAGTTRDAIHEPVWFGDKEAMLIDIAGFENATSQLSASAQDTAYKMTTNADLVLWCVAPDSKEPPQKNNLMVVHTYGDLSSNQLNTCVCAITGEGIAELRVEIESKLFSIPVPSEHAIALLPRHEQLLRDAQYSLHLAKTNASVRELSAASLR